MANKDTKLTTSKPHLLITATPVLKVVLGRSLISPHSFSVSTVFFAKLPILSKLNNEASLIGVGFDYAETNCWQGNGAPDDVPAG